MSIGLLFLGGGRASLFRSKESIAALLTAFYPRFPRSPEGPASPPLSYECVATMERRRP